jgi:hypothetical protein
MKKIRCCLLAVPLLLMTSILVSTRCESQSTDHLTLLALSKADHTLAMVDPVTLKVIARMPVGIDPHEVIASSDGKTAYVSIYGGGSLHEINVLDLVDKKPLFNIDTRPLFGPHGLTFVDGKLWFTVEGSKAVGRYDPTTNKIEWCMGTGQDRTHMIYVTNNAKRFYTTNVASGTVSIFVDTLMPPPGLPRGMMHGNGNMQPPKGMMPPPGMGPHATWEQTIVKTANGAEGFDISPDSSELWTASADNGKIYIINLGSKKLASTIDAKVYGANRLKFTPDGSKVFISSLRTGDLTVFDARTHKKIKQINIGHGAAGILMEPDGSRCFVGCTADNYVAVVDIKSIKVTGHIDVGGGPDGLAWAIQP